MVILGLDLSLTCTGLVVLNEERAVLARAFFLTTNDDQDEQRYDRILNWADAYRVHYGPVVVGIEAGIYGHGDSRPHELLGVIKHHLWTKAQRVATWAPTTVKKFATGNGRASKEEMMAAAVKAGFWLDRSPRGAYKPGSDDLADAYWVARKTLAVQ